MTHVEVWQKPTQYFKAIILQLKKNKFILKIDKGAGEAEFGPLQRVTA